MKFLKNNVFEIIFNIIFIIVFLVVGNYMIGGWGSFSDDLINNPTLAWLVGIIIFSVCTSGLIKMLALKVLNNRKKLLLILLILIIEIVLIFYLVHKILFF